jgi:glutamate-1-semialdehyde 2,1-aminomutase
MKKLFGTAQKFIPSGVNSPVRAFRAVGGDPVFVARGKGPYFWDEDGKRYIDFCCSWGPLLFGHAPAGLVRVLRQALPKGTSFGAATSGEVHLAREINRFFPSMGKVRLVSSGTEAVMSAVRLARGFTGRKKILKLDGGYHGHADSLLVKAGSGVATFGIPDSAGVPEELARLTLSIPFNDFTALEKIFKREGDQIAAFILEPVPANMGVVLPEPGYLQKARELTRKYGSLLILDEVITGFRVAPGGAQEYYGIRPDLTCLGKILGGGLPLAAFGGRRDIMDYLAPAGPVYQAGTLSGNPVAVAAALWMLGEIKRLSPVKKKKSGGMPSLDSVARDFYSRLDAAICEHRWPLQLNRIGSMFTFFFTSHPVTDYASAKHSDTKRYARFFHACLKEGIYLAPAQFEANFISFSHSGAVMRRTADILCRRILPELFKI